CQQHGHWSQLTF
nr:immunoglobulin light chain junction region [Macaca mulatta]